MESCHLFLGDNFIVPPCRRLLSLLGFVHNWPTSRWSATKKRKPVFIKRKWNYVVFSRTTILSFHPVDIQFTINIFIFNESCLLIFLCKHYFTLIFSLVFIDNKMSTSRHWNEQRITIYNVILCVKKNHL